MIKINDVEVNVSKPLEFILDGTEEYNNGTFIIDNSPRQKAYPDYSLIEIDNMRFILKTDIPKRQSIGVYQHNIEFTEEVKRLETIITPDRKYSTVNGSQVTWEYIVNDLLSCYDLHNESPYYLSDAAASLLDTRASFTEFVGGNLLDHLVRIFRDVKAVPTLIGNEIGYEFLGSRNEPISTWLQTQIDNDETQDRREESSINDYASKVYTKAKNAVSEKDNDIVSYFPYKGGYVTPRSSSNKYEDVNAQIELDSNIRYITKVIHEITLQFTENFQGQFGSTGDLPNNPSNAHYYTCDMDGYYSAVADMTFDTNDTAVWVYDQWYKNIETQENVGFVDYDWEVTNYFYKKDDWEKLEIETTYKTLVNGYYQNNTFSYSDNLITNIGVSYNISLVLNRTTYEVFIKSLQQFSGFDNLTVTTPSIQDTKWNIEYNAERDVDFIQGRSASSKVTEDTAIINDQSDSQVEISRLGESSFSKVNRIGNDEYSVGVKLKSLDDLESLFNYDKNGYAINTIKILANTRTYFVTYHFVKNIAPLKLNTIVSNDRSKFSVSNRQVFTNFIKLYNVVVSKSWYTNDTDTPSDFLQYYLNMYNYSDTYNKQINSAVYSSNDADTTYIGMSVMPFIAGRSLCYQSQFLSPTTAGAKLVQTGFANLATKRVNVNYTDNFGQVDNYRIRYCSDMSISNPDNFPEIDSFDLIMGNNDRNIFLNPDEILKETLIFDPQSDNEDILVYDSVSSKNTLYKSSNSGLTLSAYVYTDDTYLKYTQNTKGVINGYTSVVGVTVDKNNGRITCDFTGDAAFAIADSDGDLHFVQRKIDTNVLNVSVLRRNPNITGERRTYSYLDGVFDVIASVDMTFVLAQNIIFNSDIQAVASAQMTYVVGNNEVLSGDSKATANVEMVYNITLDEQLSVDSEATANVSMTYDLVLDKTVNADNQANASVEMVYTFTDGNDLNVSNQATASVEMTIGIPVEWVEVSSGIVTGGTCEWYDDIGNIMEEVGSCQYVTSGVAYDLFYDASTPQPVCSDGAEYTLCIYNSSLGNYTCRDYVGTIPSQKYECRLK